ncbi:MAG: hypothetical protein IJL39_00265 [Clostridia bacterium]|nr:hypothetical protein [Clostridia bacterium]
MKKFFKIATLVLMLTMLLGLAAGASDFDAIASELKEVGLFQGTDTGFELDREPKRVEAAVMLVRLLGAEEKAKAAFEAGEVAHPFEDVPAWADAHVAWLKANNLTNGISEKEFGSEGLCNAQMYSTFVLRALGYSDAEDGQFTYDKALDFAQSVGLIDKELQGEKFLRDDVVALSYQGLATKLNGSDKTLLEKLVDDGAVKEDAAKPLLDKAALYKEFSVAMLAADSKAVDMDLAGTINMVLDDADSEPIEITASIQAVADGTKVEFAADATAMGEAMKMWLKDDVFYMESNDQKVKMAMEGYTEMLNSLTEDKAKEQVAEAGLYLVDKIEKIEDEDKNTVYTVTMNSAVKKAANLAMAEMEELDVEGLNTDFAFDVDGMTISVKIDKDGALKNVGVKYAFTIKIAVLDQTLSVKFDADLDCTIKALGESVVIEFPDFSDFVDLEELVEELPVEEEAAPETAVEEAAPEATA